jgi:hypothetical protein
MRINAVLANAQQGHAKWLELWGHAKGALLSGQKLRVSLVSDTRSTAQNALMWSCLSDVARQVEWHGQKLDEEAWKDMATAALKRQRVVPGIDGGFVVLGQRTSKMTIAEMTELIDFLHAFGDGKDVRWSQASLGRDESIADPVR